MRVAIVTDTNSGISVAEGAGLGVYVLPMPLLVDGEIRYEGVDLTAGEFYAAQQAGRSVSTSQPSPGDVMDLWDRVLEEYDALVYIPMSSGLSASFQTALTLAGGYANRVQVADLRRISVTQKLAVLDGLELARLGLTAMEIREELERVAMDAMIYIGVETLTYLRRGGRVTPAAAALGSLLGPFGRFGVPVEDVALTLTLALRFIPEVGQELAQVRDAQRCRGAALDRGPLGVRARAWGALFAPVLLGLFRRGGRVAQALDARCYGLRRPGGGPQARTRLGARPFGWRDAAVLLVGWGLCAALALLA